MIKGRNIYFDEKLHRYTDDAGNVYTSATTIKKYYTNEFQSEQIAAACERIGRNPKHPDYEKYKWKTKKQLLWDWEKDAKDGCERGNNKHLFLETGIKNSNGYKRVEGYINDRLFTIDDLLKNKEVGRVDLSILDKQGIKERYSKIYSILKALVDKNYNLYAEIGVYDYTLLASGLIDLLAVKNKEFIIIDWKTNKTPIRFESGYYKKDKDKNILLDKFIETNTYFREPLNHISASIGNEYTIQLSTYDYLVESFGLICKGNILCHIMEYGGEELENIIPINYLKDDVFNMLHDHHKRLIEKRL